MELDDRDVRILKTIADDETRSPNHISDQTEIPLSTVKFRIKNLREAGVIRNEQYDIDLEELGLSITFIVEIVAEYKENFHEEIGNRLTDVDCVTQVYFTAGETDFFIVARLPNADYVERLIADLEKLDGVERTVSTYSISTLQDEHKPLQHISADTLRDALIN